MQSGGLCGVLNWLKFRRSAKRTNYDVSAGPRGSERRRTFPSPCGPVRAWLLGLSQARLGLPYYLVDKGRSLWGEVPQRVAKKYIVCMGVTVLMS